MLFVAPRLTFTLVTVLIATSPTRAQTDEPLEKFYSCDFESECSWTWDAIVPYGFRRIAGQEGQTLVDRDGMTAPTVDASNKTQGHFLFMNGLYRTDKDKKQTRHDETVHDETVHVVSPVLSNIEDTCTLEMYIHVSNITNQSFSVNVNVQEERKAGEKVTWVVQHINRTTTKGWERRVIPTGLITQNFSFVLGITRSNDTGVPAHIAIDNITLYNCFPVPKLIPPAKCEEHHFVCNNGSCLQQWHVCDLMFDCADGEDEQQSCDKIPAPFQCKFDNDETCGWTVLGEMELKLDSEKNCSIPNDLPYAKDQNGKTSAFTSGYNGGPNNLTSLKETKKKEGRGSCLVGVLTKPLGETGSLVSPILNPPPRYLVNPESRYFNACDFRFSYRRFGKTPPSLRVTITIIGRRENISEHLFWSPKVHGDRWRQHHIVLPHVTRRYFWKFEFKTGRGLNAYFALDDISMSPECFGLRVPENETEGYNYETAGQELDEEEDPVETVKDFIDKPVYEFTSCGVTGMEGPTEANCLAAYNNTRMSVDILGTPYQGVQRWVVPESDAYTIIARGASGGKGDNPGAKSLSSEVRSVLHLTKGQSLFFLVGQEGLPPNKPKQSQDKKSTDISNYGSKNGAIGTVVLKRTNQSSNSAGGSLNKLRNDLFKAWAGGGGGGTFVMMVNKSPPFVPILVAAGGGGLSSGMKASDREGIQHGHGANSSRDPIAGIGFGNSPAGPGGGWRVSNVSVTQSGVSLQQGGQGGRACNDSNAHGGFGGGGGGCKTGGGGGGYSGGNTWSDYGSHGEGGYSYVDENGKYQQILPAYHDGPGSVIVVPAVSGCECKYRCVALNDHRSRTACICPPEWVLSPDDLKKCIHDGSQKSQDVSVTVIVSVIGIFLVLVGFCYVAVRFYNRYQRSKDRGPRGKGGNPDVQLERLRHASDSMMTEFNPNYEFAGTTYTIRDMREIPREQLSLVKALGQGAFGEVYQGFFRHRAGDAVEMPVAVKTLPELSTNQAENDFLTEALIMSKFNHPNIVHLIGVCFDKHPRFIVLELLAGGDLKTFLRESRPRQDIVQKSISLSMHDLLTCAMDVAKGCKYLEDNRFIHRDIAARNCLLTSKGPGRVVKIADFGMAREVYMSDYYRKGGKAMLPVKWMPPEAFLDGIFTSKTDVWSFGVLLWEVMSLGYMPYTGLSNREVMRLVAGGSRLERPANCPPQVYAIMTHCWNPSQNERPSFGVILERLGYCMQDPEVLSTPMPVFNRPPSNESDSTVMRPSDDAQALSGPQALGIAEDYLIPNNNYDSRKSPRNTQWVPDITHNTDVSVNPNAAMSMISEEESAPRRAGFVTNPMAYTPSNELPPSVPKEDAPPAPDPGSLRNGPVPLDVSALRNYKSSYINVGVKDQTDAAIDSGVQPAGSVLPGSITC